MRRLSARPDRLAEASSTADTGPSVPGSPNETGPRVTLRRAWHAQRSTLVVLAAYTGLAVLLFHRAWAAPGTSNIGGPGDPIVGMWALRWTPYALVHGHSLFLTDHLNYPFGVNLMWNSPIVVHALALWPVTAVFGPLVSYNALVTLNVALSAWCAWLVSTRFVANRWAAFAGGLVYGFSPYMLAQSRDHPTLTAAYIPPLLLLVLYEILVDQRRSPLVMGAALGGLAAFQLLIAEEVLACEALVAAMAIVVAVALRPRAVAGRLGHAARALVAGTGVFAAVSAWPLTVQFLGPNRIRGGTAQPPNVFLSDLVNFVVPTQMQHVVPLWASAHASRWTGNLSELDAYLGVPLLVILAVVAVRHRRRRAVQVAAIVGVVVAVLSLGPHLHVDGRDTMISLPWGWVARLPLVANVLPARLMLYVDLTAALGVAVFVDDLVTSRSLPLRLGGSALALAGAVTLLPVLPYPSTPMAVPRFFTDGSARVIPEGSVALLAPFQQLYPADPMLWQAETNMRFRMPQGYFFRPDENGRPVYGAPFSTLSTTMLSIQSGQVPQFTGDLRRQILADLADRRVETVVVGPVDNRQAMLQLFGFVLGQAPERVSDVDLWAHVDRLVREAGP